MEEVNNLISSCIGKVLIFTKEGCPFCVKAVDLLTSIGVEPILEVIDNTTKTEIRDALSVFSNGDNKLPR